MSGLDSPRHPPLSLRGHLETSRLAQGVATAAGTPLRLNTLRATCLPLPPATSSFGADTISTYVLSPRGTP